MGNFKELNLASGYDSDTDDIVDTFYIPILSNSKSYDRISGFFRSSSFVVSSRGLIQLINNGGHMRIICSPILENEDVEVMSKYLNDPLKLNNCISECLNKTIDDNFFENECVEALGWMLLKGYLEIRLVIIKDAEGNLLSSDQIDSSGIFHSKIGIFTDQCGNVVSFSGSVNETASGWKSNIEDFDVFCSWKEGGSAHIIRHQEKFNKYWNLGPHTRSLTVSLPEAIKQIWIKKVPSERNQLRLSKQKKLLLRDYQRVAIKNWADNNYRGIFNMATGTGKTITAIYAIKELCDKCSEKIIITIAVPFQHLIRDPWLSTLREHILTNSNVDLIIEAFGSSKKWYDKGKSYVADYRVGVIRTVTFITTYDTLFSEKFVTLVKLFKGKKLLVADEVHNAGASIYRTGLGEWYDYRLGLSATPGRYLDDEGTAYLYNYFDKDVFTFSLSDAITEINPDTGMTYLTPYKYHPIFVSLTQNELEKYAEYSKKISIVLSESDILNSHELEYYHRLLVERSRITKNASKKLETFIQMIPKFKQLGVFDYCLVYCSDGRDSKDHTLKSIQRVVRELNSHGISNNRFTSEENIQVRETILDDFSKGSISTLVAIKCLDEGVDVPATRNAIIMASTGNPREYIQRRGRVLRRSIGKEYAELYDFIIIPSSFCPTKDEKQIFESEHKRFKEFSDLSLNKNENDEIISEIIFRYNLEGVFNDDIE